MILRLMLLLSAAWSLTSCATPPVQTILQARQSGRKAFEAKSKIYAPREYREYEYAMERARRFQMEEDIRLVPLFRNYTRVVEAYGLARIRANEARELSLTRQAELAAEAQNRLIEADAELADIRETVTGVPVGAASREALTEADLLIAASQRLLDLGEYSKAKRTALQALEKVAMVQNRAGLVLDRYNRPELLEKWRRWVRETVEWSRRNSGYAIVVDKSRHTCTVYYSGLVRKSYPINLGVNGFNQKFRAGDLATPEGRYHVIQKQDVGRSRYYKALLLNYPNEEDWQRFQQARRERFISSGSRIGGLIMLHGEGRKNVDWTQGCVALDNHHMDDVFQWADIGTPVTIVGRDTTPYGARVAMHQDVVAKTKEKLAKKNGRGGF